MHKIIVEQDPLDAINIKKWLKLLNLLKLSWHFPQADLKGTVYYFIALSPATAHIVDLLFSDCSRKKENKCDWHQNGIIGERTTTPTWIFVTPVAPTGRRRQQVRSVSLCSKKQGSALSRRRISMTDWKYHHCLHAGCFLFCWTPFFVVHTTRAVCLVCDIPPGLISTVTWLGYVNSALNPIIYTIFNTEFKKFFKKCFRSCCWRLVSLPQVETGRPAGRLTSEPPDGSSGRLEKYT